jgi:serine/threonine protein kinase
MKESSSGVKFSDGDAVKGYRLQKVFEPGSNAYAGKALAPNGKLVFFKKYKTPGGSSTWYDDFVSYQNQLKNRIQGDTIARRLCYEFIEFFEMKHPTNSRMKAFYQVFEWVDGGTDLRGVLDKVAAQPNAFDWGQRLTFAKVLMAGVNSIHNAGVIHADLKPENFFLIPDASITAKYKLRVIDMDYSLLEGLQAPFVEHLGYMGTPGYMSPEHSKKTVQKASDVFTCGLILGELLGGAHPAGDNFENYDDRAQKGGLNRITISPEINDIKDHAFVNHVINAMLRPEVARRPTCDEVGKALRGQLTEFDGIKAGEGSTTVPVPAPIPPATSSAKTPSPPPPPTLKTPIPPPTSTTSTRRPAEPIPPKSPASVSGKLKITGPTGQSLELSLESVLGQLQFRTWGEDFQKFMSPEQFRVLKDTGGNWQIEHSPSAKNMTNFNGSPISGQVAIGSGGEVTLGKSGKCRIVISKAS